jgi:ubiquinone/menaquinone biosynthesis C-methylase UbiE
MIYCKSLELSDYDLIPKAHVLSVRDRLVDAKAMARFEHEHRAWEYALVIKALLEKGSQDVADVGGGASVFAPAYSVLDPKHSVFQIDPGIEMHWLPNQNNALGLEMSWSNTDLSEYVATHAEHSLRGYDAVVSLSTIEHVPDDFTFFRNLLRLVRPGGLVAITFDFYPSGEQLVQGHLRTYNRERIDDLMGIGWDNGFNHYGDYVDYDWHGPAVYEYTFGALIMERRDV